MDTEGGADLKHYQARLKEAGGAYMGPSDGTLDFQTVLSEIQTLATEKHPYKTLIIDSITKLYQTSISSEAEKLGDKDAFGASKKPAIAYMRRLVAWIDKLDMNVVLIAHEASEWGLVNGQRAETHLRDRSGPALPEARAAAGGGGAEVPPDWIP
jgi:adenosyl cobinamide kinase/adenosyl cobinamide phosphate guanylyltransferase